MKWQVVILLLGFCTMHNNAFKFDDSLNTNFPKYSLEEYQKDVDRDMTQSDTILSQYQASSLNKDVITHEPKKKVPTKFHHKKYHNTNENTKNRIDDVHIRINNDHVNSTKNNTKFAPRFKNPLKMFRMDMNGYIGSFVRFRCHAEGNPTPNITWYKQGTPVVRRYFGPSYGKWSVELEDLTKNDSGNYTCIVCNELGCIEHTVALHVQARYPSKPYIKEGYPGNITVRVNDTVQLSCPTVSDLEPYVYWLKPFNFSMIDSMVGLSDMPFPLGDVIKSDEPGDKIDELTLYNVTEDQEGWYVCMAINSLGNTTANGYLTVLDFSKKEVRGPWLYDVSIFSVVLPTCVVTGLVIAMIYCSRKAITAYNLRIKNEFAKRMLVRRDRVFEALAKHLVDRKALELFQELGSGRFGHVHSGVLTESDGRRRTVVAIKSLREDASSSEENEFLREACTLATLAHEHIIRFLGVCVVDGPPLLLMEYAFFGDLLQYLQVRRSLIEEQNNKDKTKRFNANEKSHVSPEALTKFAHEAAVALAYLAQRGIVHRDVRASNCLVDEQRRLKLADFGLARATGIVDGEYQMCRRGVLPVLWMAPESLEKGVSLAASDVWSFGVLVFELVTLGRRPYGAQLPPLVVRHVVAGGRPPLPWDASADTRALTRACWRREPEARPLAARLADWLSTRWRALRPALVAELVDIDKLTNDKDLKEPDYFATSSTQIE